MDGNVTMRSLPAEIRPYERAEALGTDKLSDAELLAVLLRSGTKQKTALELAGELLAAGGGLKGLSSLPQTKLSRFGGMGRVKAITLKCAFELGKRVSRERRVERVPVREVKQLADLYMAEMNSPRELFRIVMLDIRACIITDELISMGSSSSAPVDTREVFAVALEHRATSVVLMHNHPSGDPEPSQDDIGITERLFNAGRLLGVTVVDHLVFGANTYYSFYEHGLMYKIACPGEQDKSGKRYRN